MVRSIAMTPLNVNTNLLSRLANGLITLRSFGSKPVVVKDSEGFNSRVSQRNSMPVSRTLVRTKRRTIKRGSKKLATVASVKRMIGGILEKKQK